MKIIVKKLVAVIIASALGGLIAYTVDRLLTKVRNEEMMGRLLLEKDVQAIRVD